MKKRGNKLTVFLCCIWALSLLYGEMISFWVPYLWTCSWPQLPSKIMNDTAHIGDPVKVAVLAGPQLTDRTSHGLAPKSLALEMLQFYTDLYMRRSFLESVLPFKPDLILFLGDYFDGGPLLSDEEWQDSMSRFKHIFNLDHKGRSSGIPTYYIPGNHDIGYGSMLSRKPEVISRYEKEFGPRNNRFSVGKLEFVAVDSQSLDGFKEGDWKSKSWNFVKNIGSAGFKEGDWKSKSWNFVKNLSTDGTLSPRVLLTHIPLYRPDWTACGQQRSSPVINRRLTRSFPDQEVMCQNYLTNDTSDLLLDMIRPVLVLSGHDHDQCTVTHRTHNGLVREHTVGTLSWHQGNLHPSFMLLSASNHADTNISNPEVAVSTQLCFLPMQTHIYIWYLSLFVFTILVLIFGPTTGLGHQSRCGDLLGSIGRALSSITANTGSKVKDDDEICEYEEIWDAEGSMHLIRKAVTKAESKHSNDSSLVGRGNVMARPTAKKHISLDIEASLALKMDTDVHLDDAGTILQRSDKIKRKSAILRVVRTLRVLIIIAAVNIPLYMMLLFKDWTE